jgi:arylamine N-acetyltransferase
MNFKNDYLKILKVNEAKPSLKYLRLLIKEQLRCFPYENISKLIYAEKRGFRIPTADEYLTDQREFGYGGTCYPQNLYFHRLLSELGFRSSIIQASVNDKPGAHILLKVFIERVNYYVDFGFLDPFSGPFNEAVKTEEKFIGRIFKFIPGEKFSFEIWKEDELILKFIEESEVDDLESLNEHIKNSFSSDQYFMNNLVIGRRWGSPCYNLVNDKALYHDGIAVKKVELDGPQIIEAFVKEEMKLPNYQYQCAFEIIKKARINSKESDK